MSKAKKTSKKEPEVVSNTTFNTIIENKVSRKEMIDMILEEQEASLEDELEEAGKQLDHTTQEEKRITGELIDEIENALVNSKRINDKREHAKKLFEEKDKNIIIGLDRLVTYVKDNSKQKNKTCGVFSRDIGHLMAEVDEIKDQEFNRSFANDRIDERIKVLSELNMSTLGIEGELFLKVKCLRFPVDSITKTKLKSFKKVNSLIKERINNAKEFVSAVERYRSALERYRNFQKKGKRAKNKFVREMLNNSSEGKELLNQLDKVKKETKKLIEDK